MKAFPLDKYEYYTHETKSGAKEVIAVSTYAGKIVRATAKCDPRDEYSEERGKRLAAARCNARVAAKRKARATKMLKEAELALVEAKARYEKMIHYHADACTEYNVATKEAATIAADM